MWQGREWDEISYAHVHECLDDACAHEMLVSRFSRIWPMKKDLFECLRQWKEWLIAKSLSSTRWFGIIIVSTMLHGSVRTIFVRFIRFSTRDGRSYKSRDEISLRGKGYNTLGVKHAFCIGIAWASLTIHEHEHLKFYLYDCLYHMCLLLNALHMLRFTCDQYIKCLWDPRGTFNMFIMSHRTTLLIMTSTSLASKSWL